MNKWALNETGLGPGIINMDSVSNLPGGVVIFPLREISDHRGAVLHMMRADAAGFTQFGECYFSEIFPGAVKAWKKHTLQTQSLAVPVGNIRLVMYDDRVSSATKGQLTVLELGRPDAYFRISIPPGIWYGFMCTGSLPALLANCTDLPHSKTESEVLPSDDASIPYSWNKPIREFDKP
jgi:dTDP-4-dehydrorhamnose 3,5-epimerase